MLLSETARELSVKNAIRRMDREALVSCGEGFPLLRLLRAGNPSEGVALELFVSVQMGYIIV